MPKAPRIVFSDPHRARRRIRLGCSVRRRGRPSSLVRRSVLRNWTEAAGQQDLSITKLLRQASYSAEGKFLRNTSKLRLTSHSHAGREAIRRLTNNVSRRLSFWQLMGKHVT